MLRQHALALTILTSSTALYANIPIESRALSQPNNNSSNYGAAYSESPAVSGNLNWQLMQKNQQLENDIRSLRGKLEEQENEIEKLKNELNNRYTDLDQRLQLLQQKVDPDTAANEEENPPTSQETGSKQPSDSPSVSVSTPVAPVANTTQPSEMEKAAYTVALDAYKQGGARKAITPMQNFIKNHPQSTYTGNAYFWLAEFNLAIEPPNYAEAKKNYAIVSNQYPNSAKAPRALYQLYNIAKNVDRNNTLANQYKTKLTNTYPKSEEAGFVKN